MVYVVCRWCVWCVGDVCGVWRVDGVYVVCLVCRWCMWRVGGV